MAKSLGERASWVVVASLTGAALLQPLGCDGPQSDDPAQLGAAETLTAALDAVGPAVILPTLERVEVEADALLDATTAWSEAVAAGTPDGPEREAARAAWETLFDVWQEAEVHQMGPASSSAEDARAEGRRDEVYSWPTFNRCLVDQKAADGSFVDDAFFDANLPNAYGIDALEYLLFVDTADNDCSPVNSVNAEGTWAALGEDGVWSARADMSVVLAQHVHDEVVALQDRWNTDFAAKLSEPGSAYDSEQEALDALYDALFYLESQTKDRKLGLPLGLRDACSDLCPNDVEALLSGRGGRAIAANLRGFRTLFTGGDGPGLDDLLIALGHDDIVTSLLAQLDVAQTSAEAATAPLDQLVNDDPETLRSLHTELTDLTTILKGDLVTVLSVTIPAEFAGDTD
jgi:predicted lipoprotein